MTSREMQKLKIITTLYTIIYLIILFMCIWILVWLSINFIQIAYTMDSIKSGVDYLINNIYMVVFFVVLLLIGCYIRRQTKELSDKIKRFHG